MTTPKIYWTQVDEAPGLATYSLLPIVQAFTKAAGVVVETKNISLAGRIIANFPENLTPGQRIADELTELGELTLKPEANIIKLPNVSASVPQLKAAVKELQSLGYKIPDFPESPITDAEKELKARFGKVLGSAVNPVLREGNSDRRAAASVKNFARKHPHRMGAWSADSKTHVAHMNAKDFYGSEKSVTVADAGTFKIEFVGQDSKVTVLKDATPVKAGEVLDACALSKRALREFYEAQMQDAKKQGVLLSLHLKATMMKVSDPIMFGHAVTVYFKDVFEKHAATIKQLGVNVNNGFGDLLRRSLRCRKPCAPKSKPTSRLATRMAQNWRWSTPTRVLPTCTYRATSSSTLDAGHDPRIAARCGAPDGKLHDTMAMIPDRCYATIYQAVIEDCKQHGAFDPATMGSVSNVGLMAQKAEEYGSHDKTFERRPAATVRVVDATGKTLLEQNVEHGDIFRVCQTKDEPIRDWVKLAVSRARATGAPAVFWLDPYRAHDSQIIEKVEPT